MSAAEPEWYFHRFRRRIQISASGDYDSVIAYDEGTIELRQFFQGSPQVGILNVAKALGV